MPRQVAALLCALFIIYVFWGDRKRSKELSWGIWIPQIWMFLAGTRYVTQWLNLGVPVETSELKMDGSPLDRNVFLLLIVCGVVVLIRRKLPWGQLVAQNWWIFAYFAFGAISFVWSDYPDVSLKRVFKATGNLVMALVVRTEKHPYVALGTVLRRIGFISLPLSLVFIKYYPEMGRAYSWGEPMFTGVALQKNGLGQLCLLSGIYFFWALFFRQRQEGVERDSQMPVYLIAIFLALIAWNLHTADSATSLACLSMSAGIMAISRVPMFARNPQRFIALSVTAVCVFGMLDFALDIKGSIILMLGRSPDLTDRIPLWTMLISLAGSPLTGAGFESFWLGPRLIPIWARFGQIAQAHNGYLETFLNLGVIGVFLLVGMIGSSFWKVVSYMKVDYPSAMLRLCLVITVAIYNWTEATFYGVSNLWVLMLLGGLKVTTPEPAPVVAFGGGPQVKQDKPRGPIRPAVAWNRRSPGTLSPVTEPVPQRAQEVSRRKR